MPPREIPTEALDTDSPRAGVLSAPASSSATETDELAQAEARAEAARARALRLRQQAEAASLDPSSDQGDRSGVEETATEEQAESAPSRWLGLYRLRHPSRKAIAVAAALLFSCASLAASGYVMWHHRGVVQQRQRTAEFATAARNGVLMMTSMDASKARDEMQRFADDTTGMFKAGVLLGAEDAVKALEQSKVSSKGTVQAVAVQSMTDDSAIVLVAAKTEFTKAGQAKPESRSSRLVVSVKRDAGQLKISRIEFVP